jgi:hypothetical protein
MSVDFFSKKIPKNYVEYRCETCFYSTTNKKDYMKHVSTMKHTKTSLNDSSNILTIINEIPPTDNYEHKCEKCEKFFKNRSGLWKHKQKCGEPTSNIKLTNNIILELIKQNNEFKQIILEQSNEFKEMIAEQQNKIIDIAKEGKTINNTNTNNFNLNIFLNEKCKDAINLSDFVYSLQIQLDDLEETGRLGYVGGISRIIINGLKQLDIYKRPIHCCDLKREILYIKDQDHWEKDDENKTMLKNAIMVVGARNIQQIQNFTQKYPGCTEYDSSKRNQYLTVVSNAMSGETEDEQKLNVNKIIKNISREVLILKHNF